MYTEKELEEQQARSNTRNLLLAVKEVWTTDPLQLEYPHLYVKGCVLISYRDKENDLWYLEGDIPDKLTQRFATFNQLLTYTRRFLENHNLIIERVY